jgi:hypothetical protein
VTRCPSVDHNGDVVVIPFGGQAKLFRHEMPGAIVPAGSSSPSG